MLKLKNKLITVLAILASTLLIVSAMLFNVPVKVGADAPTLKDGGVVISDSYVVGSKVTLSGANIDDNGSDVAVDLVYVYTPDGMLFQVTDSYTFTGIGIHKIVFSGINGQDRVSVEKSVMVENTRHEASAITKVTNIDELTVITDNSQAGIKVEIPYTDTFKWNTPVNLKELNSGVEDITKTGVGTPIISFLPYQFSMKYAVGTGTSRKTPEQASDVYVRLTDAYNPNVYVDVRLEYLLNSGAANQMPAYSAGAARQQIRAMSANLGRDSREGKIMFVGSERYFVTYPEKGGYPYLGNATEDGCMISLFYDVETNRVYVEQQVVGGEYVRSLINDIDAPEIYGANAFEGFTTGEVFVSIYATDYVSSNAMLDMEITRIGKQSGADLHKATAKDNVFPVIDVDLSIDQQENGLYVAKGSTVGILPARAFDVYLKDFTTEVKYNDVEDVSVDVYGKFVAEKTGKYTVIYTAIDYSGNKTEIKLVYNSEDKSDNNNKLITFSVEEYDGEVKAGNTIILPEPNIETANKYVTLKTYAVFGDEKVEIDSETRAFKVEHVGKYEIVYEYSDLFEKGEYKYELTAQASTILDFGTPALPKYMLEQATYTLDPVYVKSFDKVNPELNEATYEVKLGDGEYAPVDYSGFLVPAVDTVQFRYSYNGESVESEVIPVIRESFGKSGIKAIVNLKNYFQGDVYTENNTAVGSKAFRIISNQTSGNTVIDYVNVLSLTSFKVGFNVPSEMSNFRSISFTLTDYLDRSKSETITYTNTGAGTTFTVAGQTISASQLFANTNFSLSYNGSNKQFVDTMLGARINWESNFTSARVLLSITLSGITGKAGVEIPSLCDQNISTDSTDFGTPIIVNDVTHQGNQKPGTKVKISSAIGIDVICPSYYGTATAKKILVTVEKIIVTEDGDQLTEAMYSDDGKKLEDADATREYEITLNDISKYKVKYTYKDYYNRQGTAQYFINIVDNVKPVITINGGFNEYSVVGARLGEVVKAKGFKVSDNYDTEGLEVQVVVFDPMWTMYDLTDNDFEMDDMKFTATYKGTYIVYYYVEDSSGNVGTASYKVYVE